MTSTSKYALRAHWVVPVVTPPVAGGVVTIENGKISAVGTQPRYGAKIHDLGDVILLPGLVNAHTHLEFSLLNKPLGQQGMALPDWIRLVIASRKQPSTAAESLLAGWQESLQAGVTCCGEIATTSLSSRQRQHRPELIAFQEVIGFSRARVDSVYAELEQRLPPDATAQRTGISPHAPYTVHPELLTKLVNLARKRSLPVAMHLAESPEELELLRDNTGPFRELLEERSMWDDNVFAAGLVPRDYLKVLATAPRALVIHGNYLSAAEIAFLAEQRERMSVVYCPRTHAFFGHRAYPLEALLEAGVRVALGTDSRASNPDLSLLSEMRHVAQTYPALALEQILAMGTTQSAEALGLDNFLGCIAPGQDANLFALQCETTEHSPLAAILFSSAQPCATWLRGQKINAS